MKKALKITGIVLASLVGLVIVAVGIAVAMISSSSRLTQLVKQYAPQFISCQMELGKTDLTFFKTFPEVGVNIENVALINPMAGSPSDTLANIGNLIVVVDAKKFMKENEIIIRKCIVEDAFVNLYTDTLGNNNFNVFKTGAEDDTTSASFDYLVNIEEVKLKNSELIYADNRSGLKAQAQGLDLDLTGGMQNNDIDADISLSAAALNLKSGPLQLASKTLNLDFDGQIVQLDQIKGLLKLDSPDISLNMGESYLENDTLDLELPIQFALKDMQGHLDKAQIGLNRFLIQVDGDVELPENGIVNLDLTLNTNVLDVEDVLGFLPENVLRNIGDIELSGKATLSDVTVKGTFNDSLMPLIAAQVSVDGARVNVPQLPYPFTNLKLDGNLDLDLNSDANRIIVKSMSTRFNRSSYSASGVVDDLLGDIRLKLKLKGDVPMSDIKTYLPESMKLQGHSTLDMTTNFTVKQLMKSLDDYNLNRLSVRADLRVKGFAFDMDTIHVAAPSLDVDMTLPASAQQKGLKGVHLAISSSHLDAKVGKSIKADLKDPDIKLAADNFTSGLEKMLLNADLKFSHLDVDYDSITTHIDAPTLTFVTTPEKNAKGLNARLNLNGKDLGASMGKDYAVNSSSLKIDVSVKQNKDKTDFLNQWNPIADFILGNAVARIDGIDEDIHISNVDLLFNSSELDFKKSTFRIGQSDLSLQGSVVGIKEWIEDHKNQMKGDLHVTSDLMNINEILDLTSGLGNTDVEPAEADTTEYKENNPFMVPEGINFNFVLRTKRALYDNFDLNNLNGTITVKDGTLLLREIGFTNKAAEMQLTAMYQSPRKNNLFLAMDFHLLNVQINDLLHMVPYIDTLVPMLKTFDGQAEFHIGAETNLKSNYEPKISTLRAAADIEGKNLTVTDQFTFTKITDMLAVSTNGSYRVDSLDVQLTAFKNEIDLWPSQIAIGKYKVTVDGRMNLDKNGEYHLSVTQSPLPVRLGLKISGPFNNLDYKLEGCKYPNLYKPNKRNDTEQMYYDLKKKIADRLKENVQ